MKGAADRRVLARVGLAVGVWMAVAGVLAGVVAWRVQKGFDDNRKAELHTWCGGRARSLQQQFTLTADHVQATAGLATVFGGVRGDPWLVNSTCLNQRSFVDYIEHTLEARPWVHAIGYFAFINGSHRAAFERRASCKVTDIVNKPRTLADWYMAIRVWFDRRVPASMAKKHPGCSDGRTHPSYGPQLATVRQTCDNFLTSPYVLDNKHAGMGMLFPVFRGNVSLSSPLHERQEAFIGVVAASVDFNRLANFIVLEVLQDVDHFLEVYDVTSSDPDTGSAATSSSSSSSSSFALPSGPRLLYGVGSLPQGDPLRVATLIPPSNNTMLQLQRYKSVQQINLTDSSRAYQIWCGFQGSDTVHSWTAIFLASIIMVVAALLAAIGVRVTWNTRRVREKTAVVARLKENTEEIERNKSFFIANTAHELRTPIIGMKGMLEQLDEERLGEREREDVGTAVGEAERILSLINSVLDVSKAEAGCLLLERLPFDLRSWLSDALQEHREVAQGRGLECK